MRKIITALLVGISVFLMGQEFRLYEQISKDNVFRFEVGMKIENISVGITTDLTSIQATVGYDYYIKDWFGISGKFGLDLYPTVGIDAIKVGLIFRHGEDEQFLYYSPFWKFGLEARFSFKVGR